MLPRIKTICRWWLFLMSNLVKLQVILTFVTSHVTLANAIKSQYWTSLDHNFKSHDICLCVSVCVCVYVATDVIDIKLNFNCGSQAVGQPLIHWEMNLWCSLRFLQLNSHVKGLSILRTLLPFSRHYVIQSNNCWRRPLGCKMLWRNKCHTASSGLDTNGNITKLLSFGRRTSHCLLCVLQPRTGECEVSWCGIIRFMANNNNSSTKESVQFR